MARSRAYRWGEDGLLGICDDQGFLCLALALWNERDALLKERLFGLANPEGNHGEDVKELYYYLDATPTASYLKALYKYPQAAFPYDQLVAENRRRGKGDPEYELLDTGVFDGDRYFDVFVEYAKAAPDDLLVRITAHNRGPDRAPLHLLPTLWFRNTWSWQGGVEAGIPRPSLRLAGKDGVTAEHERLGRLHLVAAVGAGKAEGPRWLFTENETNAARLYGSANATAHVKDGFHDLLVARRADAVHPEAGTKCAAHFRADLPPGGSVELRLRLSPRQRTRASGLGEGFEEVFAARRKEADELYARMARPEDAATLRQALAGMIWSKQLYYYVVRDWLTGDPIFPPPPERARGRNARWKHVFARDVISMPDTWEFPWFAAWDLAFHTVPLSLVDPEFARGQLELMLREWYQAPSGQLAAYEYDFGDVNPPVHAWACRRVFTWGARSAAEPEIDFLQRVYPKLLMNFTWWVNRKDPAGESLFTGGFLGLDNIGVFDRNMVLPGGARLEQADATAWMAFYCNEMLAITLTLARHDPDYAGMASTFVQHFAQISEALNGPDGLWDEEAGFYHDAVRLGDRTLPLKVRSLVGLLPLVGAVMLQGGPELAEARKRLLELADRFPWFRNQVQGPVERPGPDGRPVPTFLLTLVPRERVERLLRPMLDEREFLSPYGLRSMSRIHLEHPYVLEAAGQRFEVRYLPGESDSYMFGGNSNWRGPVWMPLNALFVEALWTYHQFYGDELQVELPTGSGRRVSCGAAALELADRLLRLFRPDADGRRPCHGGERRYAEDPHWKELILFNEYFHGDTGRGCGASHQTGWTGLAAALAALRAEVRRG
jgi:hypothetical protein